MKRKTSLWNHNTDGLPIKLNKLNRKLARYNSHEEFLSNCIKENRLPKGTEIALHRNEPYKILTKTLSTNGIPVLNSYLLFIKKQIAVFFKKTEQKRQNSINETETILKQQLKREDNKLIANTVSSNETATKECLQQPKFKKFTSLQCRPKSTVKTVNVNNEGIQATEEEPRSRRPSYAQALNTNTNTSKKGNITSHDESKTNKTINKILKSLSPANQKPKEGIIWSRSNSKSDISSNYKYQQEISQLKKLNY